MPNSDIKITGPFSRLIDSFEHKDKTDENTPAINVSDTVSKVASIYEKIRNVVDYRDEHLLRKNAIKRVLKRQFVVEQKNDPQDIAKTLIYEMIRAHYLPNEKVPESRITETAQSIKRFIEILQLSDKEDNELKKSTDWLLGILACEIDEKVAHTKENQALAHAMYELMNDKIELLGNYQLSKEEKETQIYLSIHRTLHKYDLEMATYLLLKLYLPQWTSDYSREFISSFAANMEMYQSAINAQLLHPLRERFNKLFKKYSVLFLIFKDFSHENEGRVKEILAKPKIFEEKIIKICERRYKETHVRLRRAAVRTIIYIFITKMAIALAVEIPFDMFILNEINYLALGVNVAFHPLLMFALAMSVRVPSKKNTELIISNLKRMIYKKDDPTKYKIKLPAKRSGFLNNLFRAIYAITFIISFGLLIYILHRLNFNAVSTILFILFLSIVSFFGFRIRSSAKELVVTKKKEGIIGALADFFFMPIIRAGRWISINFSKINIFVFVLDFIIEAPLKTLLQITEEWFAFIREKKEEIY